jgi:hypothetical protein
MKIFQKKKKTHKIYSHFCISFGKFKLHIFTNNKKQKKKKEKKQRYKNEKYHQKENNKKKKKMKNWK